MSRGKVILVRGIPGCGKSTHVKEVLEQCAIAGMLVQDVAVCSADDYFKVQVGPGRYEYRFDPTKLPIAHNRCFAKFVDSLYDDDVKVVIVDNTFIHQWEMQNYIKMANLLEWDLEIHELQVKTVEALNRCVARNIHGVPADVIARMAMEFEPYGMGTVKVFPVK